MEPSPEEMAALMREHLGVIIAYALLFAGGLASFIGLLIARGRRKLPVAGAPGWAAGPATSLALLAGILGLTAVGLTTQGLLLRGPAASADGNGILWVAVASILLLQGLWAAGVLAVPLVEHRFRPRWNHPQPSARRLALLGLLGWLALYLLAAFFGALGAMLFEFLHGAGVEVELATQEAVRVFTQADAPLALFAFAFLGSTVVPVAEELVFRGFLYRWGKQIVPAWVAALSTSVLFGLIHGSLVAFFPLAAVGLALCLLYEISGDLRVPIVVHALFNLTQFILLFNAPELAGL